LLNVSNKAVMIKYFLDTISYEEVSVNGYKIYTQIVFMKQQSNEL